MAPTATFCRVCSSPGGYICSSKVLFDMTAADVYLTPRSRFIYTGITPWVKPAVQEINFDHETDRGRFCMLPSYHKRNVHQLQVLQGDL